MHTNQLPFWLATLYLPGIGPRKILRWLTHFADIQALFSASHDELQAAGVAALDRQSLQQPNWSAVEKDLAWMQMPDHHLVCVTEQAYPSLLKEIADPPLVLFVRGNLAALAMKQIAIVGSRHATPAGLNHAKQFATTLARSGFAITSGLARGIDAASHEGALGAQGVTIGVAGTGLHHVYPRSHHALVEDIIQHQGAVISEFPLAMLPQAANFPRRNRIIGGLSMGVLVVEAALKSGSLITAKHALDQGREVFAIPGAIHHPLARGCHHLIRQGAKLVETAADILEELGALTALFSCAKTPEMEVVREDLSPECSQLLAQISHEITPLDVILLRSRLTADKVYSILLTLELKGYIQSVMGGYVRAIVNK